MHGGFRLGGHVTVCCVHNREKRQVTDLDAIVRLGRQIGREFDPAQHKLQMCGCCANLFVTLDDTPRMCPACQGDLVYPLAAPLPEPEGVLS